MTTPTMPLPRNRLAPSGVATLDRYGQLLYINPTLCEMLGMNAAELLNAKTPYTFWPEEGPALPTLHLPPTAYPEEPECHTVRLRRKHDGPLDASVLVVPVFAQTQRLRNTVLLVRDGHQASTRTRRIPDVAGLLIISPDGAIRCMSPRMAQLLGCAPDAEPTTPSPTQSGEMPDSVQAALARCTVGQRQTLLLACGRLHATPCPAHLEVHALGAEEAAPYDLLVVAYASPAPGDGLSAEQSLSRLMEDCKDNALFTDYMLPALDELTGKLLESEGMTYALLNATGDAAFLLSRDGTVIVSNEIHTQRLNIPMQQLLGTSLYALLPRNVAQRWRRAVARVVANGKPVIFEDEENGRWDENRLFPVREEEGAITRLAVFQRDVTERRRTEEELTRYRHHLQQLVQERTALLEQANAQLIAEMRQRMLAEELREQVQARYRTLFEISPDAILVIGLDGIITAANRAAALLLDAGHADAVIGRTMESFIAPIDRDRARLEARQVLYTRTAGSSEYALRTQHGQSAFVELQAAPMLEADGGVSGVIAVVHDVTRRKRAEDALHALEAQCAALLRQGNESNMPRA